MSTDFFSETPMLLLDHLSLSILDVNQAAVNFFGINKEELIQKNINELGTKLSGSELISSGTKADNNSDKIWRYENDEGRKRYVQFTHHRLNHNGRPVRLAAAHEVTELVEKDGEEKRQFPKINNHISNSPLAVIEWTKDFVVKDWSAKAEEFFGWTEDEVVGNAEFFENFIHPDEINIAYRNRDKALKEGNSSYTVQGRNYTRQGEVRYCQWYNSFLFDNEGNLITIYSLVYDKTEQKQSEYLFKALSEESLVGVYLIQDGVFKYANPQFCNIFGYEEEEIINKVGPLVLTHPEDQQESLEHLEKRIDGRLDDAEFNFRGITKDNETIHLKSYGSRINYMGRPAIIGTIVDITERKKTLSQYEASVESYEALFDSISDAIYIQNENGEFIDVNQGALNMYGYEKERFIGQKPDFLAAPGKVDLEKTQEKFARALNGEEQIMMWWGRRKNGEVFPKEVLLAPGTFFGEKVVIAIARDISERHETERKIRMNEERFIQLFENAPIGIVMLNSYQEIQATNKAFEDVFDYELRELKGLNIDKVLVPDKNNEEAAEISSKMAEGEAYELVSQRQRKDGSLVDVMIYGVPVVVDGKPDTIFGIYVDISERKKAEERIRKSLREKEVLLAEIHHRVKNNLAVITGLLELQSHNVGSPEAAKVLTESQARINSIALIHEKLYKSTDLSRISFDSYAKELSDLIVDLVIEQNKDVDILIEADSIPLTVNQAIPCGLILNELITNSYKHAFNGSERGRIWIDMDQESETVTLKVKDNGIGLPEDFDFENHGSLGFTLIQTLSQQLDGDYSFGNSQDGGMEFSLRFDIDQDGK